MPARGVASSRRGPELAFCFERRENWKIYIIFYAYIFLNSLANLDSAHAAVAHAANSDALGALESGSCRFIFILLLLLLVCARPKIICLVRKH